MRNNKIKRVGENKANKPVRETNVRGEKGSWRRNKGTSKRGIKL